MVMSRNPTSRTTESAAMEMEMEKEMEMEMEMKKEMEPVMSRYCKPRP